jgi:hypothetical protein
MPAWVQPYAAGYLQRAQNVADMPYQAYQGQRVAALTPYQTQAYQGLYQRGMQGSPVMGAAETALTGMMDGNYQQATANPYGRVQAQGGGAQISAAQNPYGYVQSQGGGQAVSASANPYGYTTTPGQTQGVSVGSNPYAGSNPYLQQQIDAASQDVVRNYNMAAKPATDTAMQRSGSFGNSGLQQVQAMQQSDLQRNLGNIASGMRMQDYTQQQQLGEAALNRSLQGQQFNAGLGESYANRLMQGQQFNANLGENQANRAFQAQQFNSGLGESAASRALQAATTNAGLGEAQAGRSMQAQTYNSGLGESAANRSLQAATTNAGLGESYAGRNDSAWNTAQSRALQGMGMAPTFANQDYTDLNAMLSAGQGLQTQNQRYLDDSYSRFLESRNYPQQQLDVMRQALGGVNFGNTQTQTSPGTSTASSLLGGALTGASLYNMLFG